MLEEIKNTWLYKHELDEESLKIRNYIETLQSQLNIANNKLKEVKEYLKNEDHNQEIDDFGYYKHTKNILSIIGSD